MPLSFNCPACDHPLDAPDAAAGKSGDCKFCHARIIAPAQPGEPAKLASTAQPTSVMDPVGSMLPIETRPVTSTPPVDIPFPSAGEQYAAPEKPAKRIPAAMMYGDLARRLIAFVVDNIVLGLATDLFLMIVVAPILGRDPITVVQTPRIVWPAFLIIEWLYFTIMESSEAEATLGKMLLGLRVVDSWGEQLTFWRAGARCAAKWVSQNTCFIGYVMAMFNNRSQTLHDLIAGTIVIEG